MKKYTSVSSLCCFGSKLIWSRDSGSGFDQRWVQVVSQLVWYVLFCKGDLLIKGPDT